MDIKGQITRADRIIREFRRAVRDYKRALSQTSKVTIEIRLPSLPEISALIDAVLLNSTNPQVLERANLARDEINDINAAICSNRDITAVSIYHIIQDGVLVYNGGNKNEYHQHYRQSHTRSGD